MAQTKSNFKLIDDLNVLWDLHFLLGSSFKISLRYDEEKPYYIINDKRYNLGAEVNFDSTTGQVTIDKEIIKVGK